MVGEISAFLLVTIKHDSTRSLRIKQSDGKYVRLGNYEHRKINDGNRASYWSAGKYKYYPWAIADLEAVYDIDSINIINFWKNNDRYYQFDIYTSIDGQNYALLTSYRGKDTATIQGNKFDYSDNTYARYIKVVGTYNSANTQFHLSEVRAYGEEVDYDLIQLKMEADEKLSIYESVDLTKYTEATVKVFNESLESLKAVLKDETSTKEAIQTALDQMHKICNKEFSF